MIRLQKACSLLLLCTLTVLLLAGCWDVRAIDRRSYVTLLGIDMTDEGMFRTFAQVVIPRKLVGGGQGGGGDEKTFAVLSAEGTSLFEAIRNMETVDSRDLDFSHVRAYVFSRKVAEAGLAPLIDLFLRFPQFPVDGWVLISHDDVGKVMETKHYSEQMPSVFIDIFLKGAGQQTSQAVPVRLWEFHRNLNNSGLEPAAPCLLLKRDVGEAPDEGGGKDKKGGDEGTANLQIKNTCLFHRGSMVGELNARETQYLNWFWQKRKLGTLVIEDPRFPGRKQTITIQTVQIRTDPYYNSQSGQISFRIRVKTISFLDESMGFDVKKSADLKLIETAVKRQLEQELRQFITKLQQDYQVDPLGLGYKFRRKYPDIWPQIDWYATWPNVFINLEVEVQFRNRGEIQ